jgi:hypothetical protein
MSQALELLAAFYGFVVAYACLYLGCQWLADRIDQWASSRCRT